MKSNAANHVDRNPNLYINKDSSSNQLSSANQKHLYHSLYSSPSKPTNSNINNTGAAQIQTHTSDKTSSFCDHKNDQTNLFSAHKQEDTNVIDANAISTNSVNINDIVASPSKKNRTKKPKICKVCSKPILGTLVRAMGNIYHIDCFTCYDCKKPCSDKFFAADIQVPHTQNPTISHTINVPLCEYHYFKRIDLICYTCNNAIRGSYITAFGRKYHSEHFFCDVCKKVFESDNYYANEGKIYCHYHYSKLYAYHCQSCKGAILKQYVEIYRGGLQQQWHPECFMVHKFWNVDVTVNSLGLGIKSIEEVESDPDRLYQAETKLEKLTILIWLTLSEFEESSASLISEMLHATTTNQKSRGIICASKLIFKLSCLFKSLDLISSYARSRGLNIDYRNPQYQSFSNLTKEPRSLASKIMSFLTFLRDIDFQKLATNKYSHELLSLISAIAHLIKLISRNALMHSLEFNKMSNSIASTDLLLGEISKHEDYPKDTSSISVAASKATDACAFCNKNIEDECLAFKDRKLCEKRWHLGCLHCDICLKGIQIQGMDLSEITFNPNKNQVLCPSCGFDDVNSTSALTIISRYMQLAYILEIAINRSKIVHNKRDKQSHRKSSSNGSVAVSYNTTPNIERCASNNTYLQTKNTEDIKPKIKQIDKDAYENKVSEITRRRSRRESRPLNNTDREIRKSVILEAPVAWSAGTEEVNTNSTMQSTITREEYFFNDKVRSGTMGSKRLTIRNLSTGSRSSRRSEKIRSRMDSATSHKRLNKNGPLDAVLTSKLLQNESSLTLDDIPRIVSSEQAREHRPNAFRFQKRDYTSAISNLPVPKAVKTKDVSPSSPSKKQDLQTLTKTGIMDRNANQNTNTYNSINARQIRKLNVENSENSDVYISADDETKRYSDLNFKSNEYIRHIAAYALYDMFSTRMNLEDCLGFIDVHKSPSFWGKIFGAGSNNESMTTNSLEFKSGSAMTSGSGKGVFGVSLTILINKYGVDSDLGVGSQKVRIPMIVDELIHVMRTQDVSAEGVFRLNGNIRGLRQLVEEIDTHPEKVPNLQNETPIQLAALLKKFLRDLPIPLLTFKLYEVFLMSQKVGGESNSVEDELFARKRERILKLAYAMLPQCHRDLAEVLFDFLSWVSTFANIDSESDTNGGSKMDTHNLATVITPNILYAKAGIVTGKPVANDTLTLVNSVGGENQFLAIEVINDLLEMNDELSVIPSDLLELYNTLFSSISDKEREKDKLSTKDIMTKIKTCVESNPQILQKL